jgi:uncharacterized protein (TIGR02996 family)
MSPDERALLSAIDARPADDLPRLVYADWLDDHGHAVRAEFVRLQCEIARHETDRTARSHHSPLWSRQDELLSDHRPELLGDLAGLPEAAVEFDRGFPARVTVSVDEFLVRGAALAALRPRPKVAVNGVMSNAPGFFRSPHLGCVTRASGWAAGDTPGPEEWPPDYERIAKAVEQLTRLEDLDLSGCHIGIWAALVFQTVRLPALVELDLSDNDLDDVAVAALLNADLPKRLLLGRNPITDQGAFEMADRLGRSRVEYLNVRGTQIGRPGQIALLATFDRKDKKVDLF